MIVAALLLVIVGVVLFIVWNATIGLACMIVGAVIALAIVLGRHRLP